jgi:AraC-like DNA-binding protein
MEAFSEILTGLKLTGAVYFNAEFTAPWGVHAPAALDLAPLLSPGALHMAMYHLLLEGRAFAHVDGTAIELTAGDVVMFPHGDAHLITSEPSANSTWDGAEVERKLHERDLSILRSGGGGPRTRVVCGFIACDPHLCQPVLAGLPTGFRVSLREDASGRWIENSILQLVAEADSGRAGSEAVLAKVSEALVVDTLRRFVAGLPEGERGWLAGARDPAIGRALRAIHRYVERPWTVAELAKEAGLSRSALVERFTKFLPDPPMTYLAKWRLQLAARSLRATPRSVAEIAANVGYESEAAFNRAFKREFGVPPARYRKERREAVEGAPRR